MPTGFAGHETSHNSGPLSEQTERKEMEFQTNKSYVGHSVNRVSLLYSFAAIVGIATAMIAMLYSGVDRKMILFSIGATTILAVALLFFYRRSLLRRVSNRVVTITDTGITVTERNHSIHILPETINEVVVFRRDPSEITGIRVESDFRVGISRTTENLAHVLSEMKQRFPNIAYRERNFKKSRSILSWVIATLALLIIYYFRYTSESKIIRAALEFAVPFLGGLYLLLLPKRNVPFLKKGRKTLLGVALILFPSIAFVLQII